MYCFRRFRIYAPWSGRPYWQVVVRVAADIGASRWAKAAKLPKMSPAWVSRPCRRRYISLRSLLSRAWARQCGVSYASRRAPFWSSVLFQAAIRRMQVLHNLARRLLRVTRRRGRLAQRLRGLWAPPLWSARSLALFAQRPCDCPLTVVVVRSGFVVLRGCARALSQRSQGTCVCACKFMMPCLHLVACDPQPCCRVRHPRLHGLVRMPGRLVCLRLTRHLYLVRDRSPRRRCLCATGVGICSSVGLTRNLRVSN